VPGMQLQPTNDFLDKFVAPKISAFTAVSIPELRGMPQNWLMIFILSSCLRVNLDDDSWRTFYNFLRKTEAAFREYNLAQQLTTAYLENPEIKAEYIQAIDHWEMFLAVAYQAWALLARGERDLLGAEDDAALMRLNSLYNVTKHIDGAIKRRHPRQFPAHGVLPLWLENDGLHGMESVLSFEEIVDMLEDLARFAEAAQDPLTMREKIQAAYGPTEPPDQPESR
jgi:hypothetical protein